MDPDEQTSLTAWWKIRDSGMPTLHRRCLLGIIGRCGPKSGHFGGWASLTILSDDTGLSRKMLIRGIGKLEDVGFIAIRRRHKRPNYYFVNMENIHRLVKRPSLTKASDSVPEDEAPEFNIHPEDLLRKANGDDVPF